MMDATRQRVKEIIPSCRFNDIRRHAGGADVILGCEMKSRPTASLIGP